MRQLSVSPSWRTASRMRKVEEIKNRLLIKIMEALEPVISKLDEKVLTDFFEGIIRLLPKIVPYFEKLLGAVTDVLGAVEEQASSKMGYLGAFKEDLQNGEILEFFKDFYSGMAEHAFGDPSWRPEKLRGYANGGVASVPSIFGEAGPEMAIPLDPARSGRAQQLVGYVNNVFNMNGSETTSMSLASALNSREFVFQSGRMDRLNRRMGR